MSNKTKDISIKNYTYYFFDDIINIKIKNMKNCGVKSNIQLDQ